MTDRSPQLPDAAIERTLARRAPRGADATLLTEIVATAGRTRQRRSWWSPPGRWRVGPRLTLAWVAVALAGAITVGALLAGGMRHDRPEMSVVVPPLPSTSLAPAEPTSSPAPASPGPSAVPSVPPSPGAVVCSPDAIKVLTGDAMPPTTDSGVLLQVKSGTGVFAVAGRGAVDGRSVSAEVWAIHDGRQTTNRIATVTGDEVDSVTVEDVSTDGTTALIAVARPTVHFPLVGDDDVTCSEKYAVHVDGSGASRILRSREELPSGSLSPDGRTLVYSETTFDPVNETERSILRAIDTDGGNARERAGCDVGFAGWSPRGDRVAAGCNGSIVVINSRDLSTTVTIKDGDGASAWDDDSHLLFAHSRSDGRSFVDPSAPPTEIWLDRADVSTGATRPIARLGAPERRLLSVDGTFSPDRRWLVIRGRHLREDRAGTERRNYLLDRSGNVKGLPLELDGGWSTDSRSLIHTVGAGERKLLALDVATMGDRELGFLPEGYLGGIWHIQ